MTQYGLWDGALGGLRKGSRGLAEGVVDRANATRRDAAGTVTPRTVRLYAIILSVRAN